MAQGAPKKVKAKTATESRKHSYTKKGRGLAAPRKTKLAKQQKLTKKLTSGLTAKTEEMLAERAGHMELLAKKKVEKQQEKKKH
ncbi:hypothetical protein KEM55_008324 [Ascosphaera atra]|nr:hypothetical protein KEM55_008932 [Ascosphaera atra]KAI5307420.1 hypothetical protein KEM55_008324 [Ascosphaera atra]